MTESRDKVVWYGGENADQDVSIRLVPNTMNDGEVETLACLRVHSSRLQACSSYFAALMSQRWGSKRKRNPHEFTIQVDGDKVRLYKACFLRMYKPWIINDFYNLEYSLELLPVATHLGYDDLMSSICLYLAKPRSSEDERKIRNAMSMDYFPRGHAKDLLERLEKPLTREDLRPLIWEFMFSTEGKGGEESLELLKHVLETAWMQEEGTIPTFEQEMVCVLNEEWKQLLESTNFEVERAGTDLSNLGVRRTMETIYHVLETYLDTRMIGEGIKWFVHYTSFPKVVEDALASWLENVDAGVDVGVDVMVGSFAKIMLEVVKILVLDVSLDLAESDFYALLRNWIPFLYLVYINVDKVLDPNLKPQYVEDYLQAMDYIDDMNFMLDA